MALFELAGVSVAYRGVPAVRNLSLQVREGETVCLIGTNGSGKSSTMKAALGLVPAIAGRARFANRDLNGMRTDQIVSLGIGVAPEGRRTFPGLTVLENLKVGHRSSAGLLRTLLDDVYQLFPRLAQRHSQLAWSLSGGEQQMLAIGRAMMSRPSLLILDEPTLGLAPLVTRDVFRAIASIASRGTAVLVLEQNARVALASSSRGYVLERGRIVVSGDSHTLIDEPLVSSAFLG